MSELYARIYEIVRSIPPGKAETYGQVALLAGNPRLSRVVGYALHVAPEGVPCHRVVGSSGSLTGYAGGIDRKIALLKLEGTDMSGFFIPKKGTAL